MLLKMIDQIKIEIKPGHEVRELVNNFYSSLGSQGQARDFDRFFLAYQNDKLLGCVRFCNEEGVSLLRTMMIESSARRMKIGSRLLLKFEEYLEEHQIKRTYCLPYSHLEKFYGQIGFKKLQGESVPDFLENRLEGYKSKGLDCICMGRLK